MKPLPEIEPCPFPPCKGTGEVVKTPWIHPWVVRCKKRRCAAEGPNRDTRAGAITAWNKAKR